LLAQDDQARPEELADLHALRAVATPAAFRAARDAVRLIAARGFDLEAMRALLKPASAGRYTAA
jgi:hypothetical protein